jgi:hypothetical protein
MKEEFKYLFKPYFEQIVKEYHRISRTLSSTIFEEFKKLEERDLQYRDGAIGITELLQCPIKAQLRRKIEDEIEVTSNEISDGFIFEHLTKLIVTKMFGADRVFPEKTLPLDIQLDEDITCKIDGHLDIFIELDDSTVVGLELKSTTLQNDNKLFERPPEILFLDPDDIHRIDINHKYILQAKIQRYILEKLYPDKTVETYLFIKTQLKTRFKLGKTFIVLPITKSISTEQLRKLCELFYFDPRPRFPYECKYCVYKDRGFCDGQKITEVNKNYKIDQSEKIKELLEEYERIRTELKHIEDQLKNLLWEPIEYKGKRIGWIEDNEYDIDTVVRELLKKGEKLSKFLQLRPEKLRSLSRTIDLTKIPKKRKRKFKLPE